MARIGGNDIPMDGYMDISCNSMQKIILRKFAFFELFAIEVGHVVSHTGWVFFKRMIPEFFYADFTQLHTVTKYIKCTYYALYIFSPQGRKKHMYDVINLLIIEGAKMEWNILGMSLSNDFCGFKYFCGRPKKGGGGGERGGGVFSLGGGAGTKGKERIIFLSSHVSYRS